MLTGVAKEGQQINRGEPLGVVHDPRCVTTGTEIEKPLELRTDADDVLLDLLRREQYSLLRLPTRIANHSGTSTDDCNRRVAEPLKPCQAHHRQQRSNV